MSRAVKHIFLVLGFLALLPGAAIAQMFGGPKPIPRPDGPYSISGKIVNGITGAPVPGAEVAISTGPQGLGPVFEIAESGADGNFRINRLAEGKYTLRAGRRGFAGQAYLQHENYWSGIAVGPGKDSQHVQFPLFPSVVITGQVTDEYGEGVRDATVKLWKRVFDSGKLDVEMTAQAMTDDRGIYRFDHLAAGKYAVSVRATPWYSGAGTSGRVVRPRMIEGDIGDADEELESFNPALEGGAQQTGLPDVVYPMVYYPRGNDLSAASWLELLPGQEESADFQLTAIPGLRMLVQYNATEQGSDPELSAVEGDAQEGQEGPTIGGKEISPGLMEFTGLAPGRYRINTSGEHLSEDLNLGSDSEFDLREPADIESKWSATVEFSSQKEKSAWAGALVLRDEAGHTFDAPMQLIEVTRGTSVNAEGKEETLPVEKEVTDHPLVFHPVPPAKGVYDVELGLPVGAAIESLEAIGATVSGHRITAEGGDVHLKIRAYVSQVSLQGTAKKNGQAFAGAMMLLLPENGAAAQVRRDQSDSDGTFTLPNVVPGKYRLLALEHGWEMPWADPEQQKALLAKGMKIEIGKDTPAFLIVEVQ